jgi:hypothetical protein
VSRAEGIRDPSLLGSICNELRERGIPVRAEHALRYSSPNRSGDPAGRILYILFDEKTNIPCRVAKIPRTRKSAERLKREASSFERIIARNPELGKQRGALYMQVYGLPVLCERFCEGRSFKEYVDSERAYQSVLDWLVAFQRSAPDGATCASAKEAGRQTVERLAACPNVDLSVVCLLREWLGAVSNHPGTPARRVPVHGDFSLNNILLAANQVSVTDWEWAKPEGAPWEDFWAFVMNWASNSPPDGVTDEGDAGNLLASLRGQSAHSRLVRQASARFSSAAGVPLDTLWAGLLPSTVSRTLRDIEDDGMSPEQSVYHQVLLQAARLNLPLWNLVEGVLSGNSRKGHV